MKGSERLGGEREKSRGEKTKGKSGEEKRIGEVELVFGLQTSAIKCNFSKIQYSSTTQS